MPEVFGKGDKEAALVPRLAKYFMIPKDRMHYVSNLNISNLTSYEKYVANAHSKDYYIYEKIVNESDEDKLSLDKSTIKNKISSLQNNSDWEGLLKLHKSLVSRSKGNIGLDYYYTLIMKLLDQHQGQLP